MTGKRNNTVRLRAHFALALALLSAILLASVPVYADAIYEPGEQKDEWVTIEVEETEKGESGDFEYDKLYIVDKADLLDLTDEANLQRLLYEKSIKLDFDIIIVTVNDMGGKSEVAYADDYYDDLGYGRGSDHDGCLLLVHMDADRGAYISTSGRGIKVITDYGIEHLLDVTVPSLSRGDYYDAFVDFANETEKLVTRGDNGDIYDVGGNRKSFDAKNLIFGLIAGVIIALIVISILKAQLKSVHKKANATDYYDQGSLKLSRSYDRFVGVIITRTAKPKNNSGSGGSSTHTSSSGRVHGGGGRHF